MLSGRSTSSAEINSDIELLRVSDAVELGTPDQSFQVWVTFLKTVLIFTKSQPVNAEMKICSGRGARALVQ